MNSEILPVRTKGRARTVESDRSISETVTEIIEKVLNLKQNLWWFCFKARTLACFKALFQKLDLKSAEALNGL